MQRTIAIAVITIIGLSLATTTVNAKPAPKPSCPKAVKNVPARGYRAVRAQCSAKQQQQTFTPSQQSKPNVETYGSGTR